MVQCVRVVSYEKIILAITTIALVAGIVFTATGSKEQSNNIVKKIQNNYMLEWEIQEVEWVNP